MSDNTPKSFNDFIAKNKAAMAAIDGGPAFPNAHWNNVYGMTLRDYFAGQALNALVAESIAIATAQSTDGERTGFDDFRWDDGESTYAELIAQEAYIVADAMLRAREVKP
jgi:hypothetical protein